VADNGNASEPEDEIRRVRQGAALAFHEYRKALMPLVGTSEYCAARCQELFTALEAFAEELSPGERDRLLELIGKPKSQITQLLESSVQKHRFLIASLEQLVMAAQPEE
jgi:hypothetical protein